MELTDILTAHLIREEGFRSHAYVDSLGFLTIGIGRLIDQRKDGSGITREEAEYLLANDIKRVTAQLNVALPWWDELSDVRRAVLVSMAFQMGVGGLLTFTNTLRHIRQGNYFEASVSMFDSKWARQTPNRAIRLAAAMRSDDPRDL